MIVSAILFSGSALGFGGLSNENDLVIACPEEFKKGNRWTYLAGLFASGEKKPALKWVSNDEVERRRQWDCFRGVISSIALSFEDKIAVAGWMLSVITTENPAD